MESFLSLGLSQPLVDSIGTLGFKTPTLIQQKAIPSMLTEDRDLVGLAQTGTGKTAAFGLPLVELVNDSEKRIQALVLAPTRELCLQIQKELSLFGQHRKNLKIKAVYGGTDIGVQIRDLRRGAHIIAATPGRLRDLIRREVVDLEQLDFLVLDEADEMLNMGFKEELDDILQYTPEEKRTWLFSATMPAEVRRISRDYMVDPIEVEAGKQNEAHADIEHQFVITRASERLPVLKRFLDVEPNAYALVFCRTRRDTKELADQLMEAGYHADALHGDLNQIQRDRVMARFRQKQIQILVATDVAARGIDVQDLTHVFHFNLSEDLSFYKHRAGRTGRAGSKGVSLVLLHPKDMGLLKVLERRLGLRFSKVRIPTGEEICGQRLKYHFEQILEVEPTEEVGPYIPELMTWFSDMSKEDLVRHMASLSFSKLLDTYRNAPDLNVQRSDRRDRKEKRKLSGPTKRLFINIGYEDVEGKGGFLSFVCHHGKIPGSTIGKIDLQHKFAFFDVEDGAARKILQNMDGLQLNGRGIRVDESQPYPKKKDKKRKRRHKKSV